MEDRLDPFDDQGVPGVVAALKAGDDIRPLRIEIDNLPFSLVTPLGADDRYICHNLCSFTPFPVPSPW